MTLVDAEAVHEDCGGEVEIETQKKVYGSRYICEDCGPVHPTEVRFPNT